MTLVEARALIVQEQSPKLRAAAEQLLNEATALPHLPSEQREAAITRIRQLETTVPDYQLSSFGASVLEAIGDSLGDRAQRKIAYTEALYLAEWYASGATSGGEGTARSRHVRELEQKLQALDPASIPPRPQAVTHQTVAPPPPMQRSARRPKFLTGLGWIFIIVGGLGTPVSFISLLMILVGSHGSQGGSFFEGLIVIAGPPATLIAGIGLLRRQRWAHGYAIAVLLLITVHSLVEIVRGDRPEVSTVSPSGLITTQLAWSVNYPLHIVIIAICVGLVAKLLSPAMRAEFSDRTSIS